MRKLVAPLTPPKEVRIIMVFWRCREQGVCEPAKPKSVAIARPKFNRGCECLDCGKTRLVPRARISGLGLLKRNFALLKIVPSGLGRPVFADAHPCRIGTYSDYNNHTTGRDKRVAARSGS